MATEGLVMEFGKKKCIVGGCNNKRHPGSKYCEEHKCKFSSCTRGPSQTKDSGYCGFHHDMIFGDDDED